MKKIYVEQYEDCEERHVYIDIDGHSYLEAIYSRGSIAGILVQKHPLTDRLKDHNFSNQKTGEISGISDEMFEQLIKAAKVVSAFREVLIPILLQPKQFLKEARLEIATSI